MVSSYYTLNVLCCFSSSGSRATTDNDDKNCMALKRTAIQIERLTQETAQQPLLNSILIKMAISTCQLSMLTVGLLVHLSYQYSFKNCIGNSNNKTFECFKREEKSISNIVGDLPASAIDISITFTSVRHIPTGAFKVFTN